MAVSYEGCSVECVILFYDGGGMVRETCSITELSQGWESNFLVMEARPALYSVKARRSDPRSCRCPLFLLQSATITCTTGSKSTWAGVRLAFPRYLCVRPNAGLTMAAAANEEVRSPKPFTDVANNLNYD